MFISSLQVPKSTSQNFLILFLRKKREEKQENIFSKIIVSTSKKILKIFLS
jgi:hypothetical protein